MTLCKNRCIMFQNEQISGDFLKPLQIKALLSSPLFNGISEKEATEIFDFDKLIIKTLKKGEAIYTQTDFSRCVGVVLSGAITVEKISGSKKIIMSTSGTGSTFGMAAVFYEKPVFPTVITAQKLTTAAFFTKEMLSSAFKKSPVFTENYIYLLSGKIHFLNSKIETFSSKGRDYKLYHYIIEEYGTHGKNNKVTLKYNMTELASLLGIGRTSLYRELDELTEKGLLAKEGKTFTILKENEF